jgi:DNA-binding XRE family transcriptional regulator
VHAWPVAARTSPPLAASVCLPQPKAHREIFEQAYAIAVQIVDLRGRHGLTQAELAKRCGMDQADISRIERGSTSPTSRTLLRIAEALDADLLLVARAP